MSNITQGSERVLLTYYSLNKMDMMLAKFLVTCFLCELVAFTAGVPLRDTNEQVLSIKQKRSSLTGGLGPSLPISLPNPISLVNKTLNSVGGLLTPSSQKDQANDEKPTKNHGYFNKKKRDVPELSPNANTNTATSPSDILVQSNTVIQNIQPDKYNKEMENKNESTNLKPIDESKEKDTNKKNTATAKPDLSIIDSIFNEVRDSITTENYTTETGTYESVTTDKDLIRMPTDPMITMIGG